MLLQPNSKILFIGDSITDCGRKRPIGKGEFDQALGNGYVSLVDAALRAVYPDHPVTTLNMGISGNTVDDLAYRWKTDAIELKPDWLSILIGINDAWQQFNQLWPSTRGTLHEPIILAPESTGPSSSEELRKNKSRKSLRDRNG